GRLAVRLAGVPHGLLQVAADVAAAEPDAGTNRRQEHLPTSVDLLAPGAPALELLASQPRPADVCFHSVIGVLPGKPNPLLDLFVKERDPKGTDGVVPYGSAHLDDVESELVVPADHSSVHHHPLAALEVRRILLEHLRGVSVGLLPPTRTN